MEAAKTLKVVISLKELLYMNMNMNIMKIDINTWETMENLLQITMNKEKSRKKLESSVRSKICLKG